MKTGARVQKIRMAKACRSCRRRKVRCDMEGRSICRACERRSSACVAASPPTLSRAMEQALCSGTERGLLASRTPSQPDNCVPIEPPIETVGAAPALPTFEDTELHLGLNIENISTKTSSAVTDSPDADPLSSLLCFTLPRCLGGQSGSSPLSMLSPEGNQWLHGAVGDGVLNWDILSPSIFGPDSPDLNTTHPPFCRQFISLPPKDDARHLLNNYFKSFNPFCPTFDEKEFMLRFEHEYPIQPDSSAEKWACLNSALALACLLDPRFCSKAWLFWKNATLSWGAFFTQSPNLLSAQALVAMTMYLIGTFHGNPSSALIPMAIRTLHGLAPTPGSVVPPQFRMILMIARCIDIDHALQAGMPPTDLGLEDLYHDIRVGGVEAPNPLVFDCYDAVCRLICLKEDVYRELYSLSAQDKSDSEVISRVGKLDTQLEEWKRTIPEGYRPGYPIHHGNSMPIIFLHLSYHNCLLTIHRRAIPCTTWSMRLDPALGSDYAVRSPNSRTLISTKLCAEAARTSMRLIKYIPPDNPLICGVMVYYIIFALKLLVILIVDDPWSPRARADITLLRNMEEFLVTVPATKGDQSMLKLMDYCAQYRQVAEKAVRQVLNQMKRRRDEQAERDSYTYAGAG
ncbi:hypothetical protein BJX76DRAFT_368311 [Aspergillus varians]